MHKRLSRALMTAALLAVADPAISVVYSKPPDLPLQVKDTFEPQSTAASDRPDLDGRDIRSGNVRRSGDDQEQTTPLLFDVLSRFFEALQSCMSARPSLESDSLLDQVGDRRPADRLDRVTDDAGTESSIDTPVFLGPVTFSTMVRQRRCPTSVDAASMPATQGGMALTTASVIGFAGIGPVAVNGDYLAEVRKEARLYHTRQVMQAARLYAVGVNCENCGDWAMARNCFEEVTRLCPHGDYAIKAGAKLAAMRATISKIEAMMARSNPFAGGVEESEPPAPQGQDRDLIMENRHSLRRIHESQRMYRLGEHYQAAGHLEKALACYQDSHLICPACRHGRQAFERMVELQAQMMRQQRKGGAEEQEPPLAPRRLRYNQASLQRRDEARGLYLLGERCRVGGDLRMACTFYTECVQTSPGSYYGICAQERLAQLQARERFQGVLGGAEAQEPPAVNTAPAGTQARRWNAVLRDLFDNYRDW
jgi:hypothetical protein